MLGQSTSTNNYSTASSWQPGANNFRAQNESEQFPAQI